MSSPATDCGCPCVDPTISEIPGVEGAAGVPGTDGANAFSHTAAEFTIPAKGFTVIIQVDDNQWVEPDAVIYIETAGWFEVNSTPGDTFLNLTYLDINANVNSGNGVLIGALVMPSGPPADIVPPLVLADNTGGTPVTTLVATSAIQTLTFYIPATTIANGDLLTTYVPGYAFKILKFDTRCVTAVTTTPAVANLNLEIGTTDLTGGVIALNGAYARGAAQNGSAITAANVGTASDSFSIEASGVTAFTEGSFVLLLSVQNLDTLNALSGLAAKANELVAAIS